MHGHIVRYVPQVVVHLIITTRTTVCNNKSEPNSFGILEHLLEIAGNLKVYDLGCGADELAADEDGGHGGATAHVLQSPLQFLPELVEVQLVLVHVHPHVHEQHLDAVAHAARGLREYHHRLLCRYLLHHVPEYIRRVARRRRRRLRRMGRQPRVPDRLLGARVSRGRLPGKGSIIHGGRLMNELNERVRVNIYGCGGGGG
ncbi:unnamed protein product [Cuscuta epithymum]|uniref:Uncharacterized protein n=1 Tax=Cuscuta epithymum TaxID=186058 RepID=A0AAV0DFJ2_9ASTE|nr:unnamed protein product [Cuscuta epithymum]